MSDNWARLDKLKLKLEHLDLKDQIFDIQHAPSKTIGSSCDILIGQRVHGGQRTKVALKRLRFYTSVEKDFVKDLTRELYIWSNLRHKNIHSFMGYYVDEFDHPNLISEYMENGNLMEYLPKIARGVPTLIMVGGIASGLSYLHSGGIIHADLKTTNIFVSSTGEPLLADFGLSYMLASSSTVTISNNTTCLGKGTMRWMAPELIQTSSRPDAKSDVWAFGMIIYELLSRQRPYYDRESDIQVMYAIIHGVLPLYERTVDVDAEVLGIEDKLLDLCHRCWIQEPKDRLSQNELIEIGLAFAAGRFLEDIRPLELPAVGKLAKANEETWILIGSIAKSMDNMDRAFFAYENALRHNPYSMNGLMEIADIYYAKENYVQAIEYYERVIQFDLPNGEVWSTLGHCYVMQDDLQEAFDSYQRALDLLPNPKVNLKLWCGIGILYSCYGSLGYAEEAFTSVLQVDKQFEKANEILFHLGMIYKQQGKHQESLECFNRILCRTPADIWVGRVYEQQKDLVHAKEAYERILQENPHNSKVLQQLGWLHHQDGSSFQNQDLAITYVSRSLEANPSDAHSWYLLGRAYVACQKYHKAYEAYQQAVYRDGRNPTFWCSIGVLYFYINQYRDALDAYSRAIRINIRVSEVWFNLGSLYEWCNHQISDSIDCYGLAAGLDPSNTQVADRLQLLKESQQSGAPIPAAPGPKDVHPMKYANVSTSRFSPLAAAALAEALSGAPLHPQSHGPPPGAPPLLMLGEGGLRAPIFSNPDAGAGDARRHAYPSGNVLLSPPSSLPPFRVRDGPTPPLVLNDNHGRGETSPPRAPLGSEHSALQGPGGTSLLHHPPTALPPSQDTPAHRQPHISRDIEYYKSGESPPESLAGVLNDVPEEHLRHTEASINDNMPATVVETMQSPSSAPQSFVDGRATSTSDKLEEVPEAGLQTLVTLPFPTTFYHSDATDTTCNPTTILPEDHDGESRGLGGEPEDSILGRKIYNVRLDS